MAVYKVKYTYEVEVEAEDEYHASQEAEERLTEDMGGNYLPEVFNEDIQESNSIEPIKAGVVIDENYFEEIVGRKPKSQDELATFASRVEKGIEVSCHWETVNDEARMEIKRIEEKRAMEK